MCRRDPRPEDPEQAFTGMGMQVCTTVNGPSEFTITGPQESVDVTPQVYDLRMPLLFICGEPDEATPESTRHHASLVGNAQAVVISGASRVANHDQPEARLQARRSWLDSRGLHSGARGDRPQVPRDSLCACSRS